MRETSYGFVSNTLDTPADVEQYVLQTAMPLTHGGRLFETIGQTLDRMMGAKPQLLPGRFVDRLIASLAANTELADALTRLVFKVSTASGNGPTRGLPAAIAKANQEAVKSRTGRRRRA